MKSVRFKVENTEIEARPGDSVLEASLRQSIEINHSCGGFGTCGTCRVIVEEGLETLENRNELEMDIANDRGFKPEERLSCQICPTPALKVRRPSRS